MKCKTLFESDILKLEHDLLTKTMSVLFHDEEYVTAAKAGKFEVILAFEEGVRAFASEVIDKINEEEKTNDAV